MGVHVTHEHLVLVVTNQFTHVGQLQVARTPPEGQVHHHHHQGFRAFAKTHKDRPAPFGAWQGVIFNSRGFEAAEYAIAVLRQSPQVAVELLIPVREGAQLSQVFHLVDIAGAQAAAVGFLQRDQVEVAEQVADFLQVTGTPLVGQQVLPATREVMPILLGTVAHLDIETEQAQAAICRQACGLQVMLVDLRFMQANDTLGTPAAHGEPLTWQRVLWQSVGQQR